MLKTVQDRLLPSDQKNIKKVLGTLDQKLLANEKKEGHSKNVFDIAATADELTNLCKLSMKEINHAIATLKDNADIERVYFQDSSIAYYYITSAGVLSHYRDRYGNEGRNLLNKNLQFWVPILVAILAAIIPSCLNKIDTQSLEKQVERQQLQIDSLKKAVEPKPILKPTPFNRR